MFPKFVASALAGAVLLPLAILAAEATIPPYLDRSLPQKERVDDLISRMTLEEKASMMTNTTPGVPRLGIPKYNWWSEALHGVANAGTATVFPQAIGLAAMWNEPFQQEIATVIGIEGRAKFNGYVGTPLEGEIFRGLTFWSPNVNIFRDPRWGRGQETYGEDPFLTSRLGVAFVRGLQGDDPDYLKAAACAKHFAVHSGPEPLRHIFDVAPVKADLYETYLPAFEALVREGRVEIVMTAYNAIDGIPCSIHPQLYGFLKEWGFSGHVTSDCGSVSDLINTYKMASDEAEAQAMTFLAGMNVRCDWMSEGVPQAVERGLISEAQIDSSLHPLLRTMFKLGFFDPKDKVPFNSINPSLNDSPEHGALALRAARESMVLLKNDGILPLDTKKIRRVAVVGPNASSQPVLVGNYNGEPSAPVTVLDGIRAALEPLGIRVDYSHGCDYADRSDDWRLIPHPWFRGEYYNNGDFSGTPAAWRTERPICHACSTGHSDGLPSGVSPSGASVRWNGELQSTLAGEYRFRVRGIGGFRLRVDGKLLVDSMSPVYLKGAEERSVTVSCNLPDNAILPIQLEYVQGAAPLSVALEWITPAVDAQMEEALGVVRGADMVIYVGGISAQLEGEEMAVDYEGFVGGDRISTELPELQQRLLKAIHASGKPVVMVNMSGSAVALPWADANLNAVLQAWYPGQAGGTAVADVITGKYNPAGRLPLTFYRSTEDLPDFDDYAMEGRTYKYFRGKPLYAFGHGLSYTSFDYSAMKVSRSASGDLTVKLKVRNSGKRDGDEVVQLYAVPPASSAAREVQALCGFKRLFLKAGETKEVVITVPASALRRWSDKSGSMFIPSGEWTIRAAASSADIRLSSIIKL